MHLGCDQEFDMNQAPAKFFEGKLDVLLPSAWETFQFTVKLAAIAPAMFKLIGRVVKKGNAMKSCKLSWSLVAVLSMVVAVFAYKFTVGEVKPSTDGRLAVQLSKDERNALLLEMRTWLQSTQAILAAASAQNFSGVVSAAKASGMAAEAETPGSLFRKIPVEMKRLGFDTRQKFDEIAADAQRLKDSQHTMTQLSTAMNNCIACHAIYRFVEAEK
jgi:hypothetical protein